MNKNLELLFDKIINDEVLAKQFIEKETVEDLYKLAITIQDGYTIEELEEFIIKMLKFAKNEHFELLVDENDLSKVSGGRVPMNRKVLSTVMASLMAMSAVPMSAAAMDINSDNLKASVSQKDDNSIVQRIKQVVKGIYDNNKKSVITSGAVGTALITYGVYRSLKGNNTGNINNNNTKKLNSESAQQRADELHQERLNREEQAKLARGQQERNALKDRMIECGLLENDANELISSESLENLREIVSSLELEQSERDEQARREVQERQEQERRAREQAELAAQARRAQEEAARHNRENRETYRLNGGFM